MKKTIFKEKFWTNDSISAVDVRVAQLARTIRTHTEHECPYAITNIRTHKVQLTYFQYYPH